MCQTGRQGHSNQLLMRTEHFIITLVKSSVVIDFNEKDFVYSKKLRLFYLTENT